MNKTFKIVFAGTPEFACPALEALLHSTHSVKAVYTQPDRPKGRGRQLTPSPIKLLAQKYDIPVYQPLSLKNTQEQEKLLSLKPDVLIVAAYGLILPKEILSLPKYGCLNIHASLLPRWRGASPIQAAILAGDIQTGITIMQMNEGLDTGGILKQIALPIVQDDTSLSLQNKLSLLGADTLLETLNSLSHTVAKKQEDSLATYAPKILKSQALLDFHKPALILEREIRAYNPWPVSFMEFKGELLRVWKAEVVLDSKKYTPGEIVFFDKAHGFVIATGENLLSLLEVQRAGGKRISIQEFLNQSKF